jgi:hypothetical protein
MSFATFLALPYFSTLSHISHDFWGEKILDIKCVFLFPLELLYKTFLILSRIHHVIVINVEDLHVKYPLFLSHLMKLEFSRQISQKNSNIKFDQNPSSGSEVVPCGRTDTHNEADSRLSQFWACA